MGFIYQACTLFTNGNPRLAQITSQSKRKYTSKAPSDTKCTDTRAKSQIFHIWSQSGQEEDDRYFGKGHGNEIEDICSVSFLIEINTVSQYV
jgi:hypothetical protein